MTAWPVICDRLLELLPALPGWEQTVVYDGPPVTADAPMSYATIGYVLGEDSGGSFRQERGTGNLLEETGAVLTEIVCTTGDVDLPAMRAAAFALVDAWQQAISDDQTLGVLMPSSTSALSVDVQPAQTTSGTVQRLVVTLDYFTRS